MQKVMFGLTSALFGAALVAGTALADSPRGAVLGGARGRTVTSARMPSMPTLSVNAVGNFSTNVNNVEPTPEPNPNPNPNPNPGPNPGPNPWPINPDEPDTPVDPTCPDGGVANSAYTVDSCMNDILGCVNGGALPNGINSMFNEDLRNSIVNGMGLCLSQVEYCIANVRKDCHSVYESSAEVWLDFNARKVQPEYYRFVLAQTGLTPTQAENTCLLLDRNTYGASFDAVSDADRVTSEYNQEVGAYNSQQNNTLTKANPLGEKVNSTGIDGQRGYYARWDAEKAQCLLRVAAYNKDDLIENKWMWFGFGDETPAEVWQSAGSTFTCNKDLFGFSLMNQTKGVAVAGGIATVAGAGIGALAGHGDKRFDCKDESMRKQLLAEIQDNQLVGRLNQYVTADIATTDKTLSATQCNEIVGLYDLWQMGRVAYDECKAQGTVQLDVDKYEEIVKKVCNGEETSCSKVERDTYIAKCTTPEGVCYDITFEQFEAFGNKCLFVNLNQSEVEGTDVYCKGTGQNCIGQDEFKRQLDSLGSVFGALDDVLDGEKSNRLKTTLVGAGIGAGVGGTATAITAFIERNNINCRVADGLAKVGFGKSYTIDRLRDFYVKWALNLPQTLAPTAVVTNCENWELTCAMFTDLDECDNAQFNYRSGNLSSTTLVPKACKRSGSACIANLDVARAKGACLTTPAAPDVTVQSVKNCGEWTDVCSAIKNSRTCNEVKVVYTPKSMQVANACRFDMGARECRVNRDKAKQYLNLDTCPVAPEPVQR